jgi:hypothetical protein
MKLAALNNEIVMADFQQSLDVPIELTDLEKTQHNNEWRTYRERSAQLVKNRGQAFSLILGQCTQLLQDKMKQDTDWITVSTSYDPLTLYRLIEKTTLAQTEDQYPFATVYEQETAFYLFQQNSLTNPQWYERFNTKIDVGAAIGVTRQHKALLEYVAKELHHQAFATLAPAEQQAVRKDAEERYIAYAFLRQSGKQNESLKVDLKNDFTTGDNRYPKNRQQTLHLLDNYSKISAPKPTPSEGSAFAQKGNKGNKGDKGDKDKGHRTGKGKGKELSDEEYWQDKTCFKCGKKGHPAPDCPNADDDDDDDKSRSSQARSVTRLANDVKRNLRAISAATGNAVRHLIRRIGRRITPSIRACPK